MLHSAPFNVRTTPARVDTYADRMQAEADAHAEAEADRAELVAQIAKERLKTKLAALSDDDLIGGMHSVTQQKHARALRAAFRKSLEALGDLVMSIIVHAMSEDAALEAERSVDGDGPRFSNVGCSACGQTFGPGDAGFSHCADHISRRIRLFDEV